MDCSTCRSLFSESFDGRLAAERRQGFIIHVQACGSCDSEYGLYRRVFSAVRGLPEETAPPFRAPAEVPGALSTAERFGSRPRFARVAAALLIMLGLAGTHVLVFQWSRDHATRNKPSETRALTPEEPASLMANMASMTPLPAALRDHVDATDLFIRTAASLPEDAGAVDVAKADWAATDLVKRTNDLKTLSFSPSVPPEHQAIIIQYLRDMDQEFIPMLRNRIDDESGRPVTVRAIMDGVIRTRVVRDHELDKMKLITASLPRGTSFARAPFTLAAQRLNPDGQLFLVSKHARLSGDMQGALAGLQRFDSDFQRSPLRPAAQILQVDTLLTASRWAEAFRVAGQASCRCQGGAPEPVMMAARWIVRIDLDSADRSQGRFGIGSSDEQPLDHPMFRGGQVQLFGTPEVLRVLVSNEAESRPAKK